MSLEAGWALLAFGLCMLDPAKMKSGIDSGGGTKMPWTAPGIKAGAWLDAEMVRPELFSCLTGY